MIQIRNEKLNFFVKDMLIMAIACVMYSVSAVLISQLHVVAGSVLGIAELCYIMLGIPMGYVSFGLNIPIMIICVRRFGSKVLYYTLLIVATTSILMNVLTPYVIEVPGNMKLLVMILCGMANGLACGLVMRVGGSVGGTTAIVRVLKSKFQRMNVTAVMFFSDAVIILMGVYLLKNWSVLPYSILFSLSASVFVDIGYTLGRKNIDKVGEK